MNPDPPKYRPLERFWPYAELPEQPTDEELAALDPDLHDALFGVQPRPFSITLVFPAIASPDFPRALEPGEAAVRADGVAVVRARDEAVMLLAGRDEEEGPLDATSLADLVRGASVR